MKRPSVGGLWYGVATDSWRAMTFARVQGAGMSGSFVEVKGKDHFCWFPA
jgi:hypothetical protein